MDNKGIMYGVVGLSIAIMVYKMYINLYKSHTFEKLVAQVTIVLDSLVIHISSCLICTLIYEEEWFLGISGVVGIVSAFTCWWLYYKVL